MGKLLKTDREKKSVSGFLFVQKKYGNFAFFLFHPFELVRCRSFGARGRVPFDCLLSVAAKMENIVTDRMRVQRSACAFVKREHVD